MITRRWRVGVFAGVMTAALLATVAAQGVNVTGDWTFDVQTDQGADTPAMTFNQTGEALTGTYVGTFGSATLKGSVKGTAIEFSFEADAQGQKVDSVYKGTVDKDTMKGTVSIAGGQLNGTFVAKKK